MPLKMSSGKPSYIGRYGGLTVPGTTCGRHRFDWPRCSLLARHSHRAAVHSRHRWTWPCRRLDSVVETLEIKRLTFSSHAIHAHKTWRHEAGDLRLASVYVLAAAAGAAGNAAATLARNARNAPAGL